MMQKYPVSIGSLFHQLSGRQVRSTNLLGSGMCNDAWCITTVCNQRYVVKIAKTDPEEQEQNDLVTEARLLQALNEKNTTLPIPRVAFASASPMLYGYGYLPGQWMKDAWPGLTPSQKQQVCTDIAWLHAELHQAFTREECIALGLSIDRDALPEPENEADLATVLADNSLPASLQAFATTCSNSLQATAQFIIHAFCHNDSHHENILVQEGRLTGMVDFGDADYGDVHREFGRYATDYPTFFESIVHKYEMLTGRRLSRHRIIAYAFLEQLEELADDYRQTQSLALLNQFENLWQHYQPESA